MNMINENMLINESLISNDMLNRIKLFIPLFSNNFIKMLKMSLRKILIHSYCIYKWQIFKNIVLPLLFFMTKLQ
jgi:hypothetical protein